MIDHHDCTVCPCPQPRGPHCPCLHRGRARLFEALADPAPVERQTWERRLGGTDVAEVRVHLEVDDQGRVRMHEALAARLLHEAGWERTA